MKEITPESLHKYLTTVDVELNPTQQRLCVPIIKRIHGKMINDLKFDDIRVHENLIIDGHHRFVSALIANKRIESVSTQKTSATIAYAWKDVQFVNEEWDTAEKIAKLNKEDADFNNIALDKIYEMSK